MNDEKTAIAPKMAREYLEGVLRLVEQGAFRLTPVQLAAKGFDEQKMSAILGQRRQATTYRRLLEQAERKHDELFNALALNVWMAMQFNGHAPVAGMVETAQSLADGMVVHENA